MEQRKEKTRIVFQLTNAKSITDKAGAYYLDVPNVEGYKFENVAGTATYGNDIVTLLQYKKLGEGVGVSY